MYNIKTFELIFILLKHFRKLLNILIFVEFVMETVHIINVIKLTL